MSISQGQSGWSDIFNSSKILSKVPWDNIPLLQVGRQSQPKRIEDRVLPRLDKVIPNQIFRLELEEQRNGGKG